MDQFTFAERATDWRGNNNIAETIFAQLSQEDHPVPRWIVVGAGTGGTSTTVGRYIRYQGHDTGLCVVDPEHSITFDYYRTGDATLTLDRGSRIEGIGRPRVEPSFIPTVVDRMIKVPDAASFAAMFFANKLLGRRTGPSTGTNLWGAFELIAEMRRNGEEGLRGHADLRFRRSVPADLLQRCLDGAAEDRPPAVAPSPDAIRRERRMGKHRSTRPLPRPAQRM